MTLPPNPAAERRSFRRRLLVVVASCFGLGYSPVLPGTCGAALGIAIYLPIAWLASGEPWQSILIGLTLLFWCWLTVALGDWAEKYYLTKDSSIFVTDEVAGFLFTVLLFHPSESPLTNLLWTFPVTRVIDIAKVPPAKQLEKLPSGWGVLADDLLGSCYAAGLLWLVWCLAPHWF